MRDVAVDTVFVGSCTNGRIEDLRAVAEVMRRPHRSPTACGCWSCRVRCGCGPRPNPKGLGEIFTAAGAEWRQAGCSMCLGMNPDQLAPGERCASTSNRNFEGRQGKGGRTHLVSPLSPRRPRCAAPCRRPADLDADRGRTEWTHSHPHRHRRSAAAVQCRHRPDHPGRVPEAGHPNGFRGRAVRRAGATTRLSSSI